MSFRNKRKNKTMHPLFRELAQKNVKRSVRDYLIYFLTLTFGVCLFYTFNSIGVQFSMLGIRDMRNYLAFAEGMIAVVSVFVCMIIGFLVVYANNFMLKRRKKEIGLYFTLGMAQKSIAELLFKETCIIGAASLAAGLTLGVIVSHGLCLLTAEMIGVQSIGFRFMFSASAFWGSFLFFGLILLIVHKFNVREIRRLKLIDLLYAVRKNETVKESAARDSLLFLVSAILLTGGYVWILQSMGASFGSTVGVGILLIGAGTFCFFFSASGLLLKLFSYRKAFYYRGLNMFVLRQLSSRIKSANLSIAVISILLTFSVTAMSVGMGIGTYLSLDLDDRVPYDTTVEVREDRREPGAPRITPRESLEQAGFSTELNFESVSEFTLYITDDLRMKDLLSEGYPADHEEQRMYSYDFGLRVLGAADYNRAMAQQGKETLRLGENEFAVIYNVKDGKGVLEYYMENHTAPVFINGYELRPLEEGVRYGSYRTEKLLMDTGTLIVPQKAVEGLRPDSHILNGNFKNPDIYESFTKGVMRTGPETSFTSKQDVLVEITSSNAAFSYIGMFAGITFLITAGAVLALQQLSQSADNEERYRLLRKIGANECDMRKSVLAQLFIYFGFPFSLACVSGAVMITGIYRILPGLTRQTVAQNILLASAILLAVYGLYFLTTYIRSRQVLHIGR